MEEGEILSDSPVKLVVSDTIRESVNRSMSPVREPLLSVPPSHHLSSAESYLGDFYDSRHSDRHKEHSNRHRDERHSHGRKRHRSRSRERHYKREHRPTSVMSKESGHRYYNEPPPPRSVERKKLEEIERVLQQRKVEEQSQTKPEEQRQGQQQGKWQGQ